MLYLFTNFSDISTSIDTLLTNNYKSINAANTYAYAIDNQNSSIFDYIHSKKLEGIDSFYKNGDILIDTLQY